MNERTYECVRAVEIQQLSKNDQKKTYELNRHLIRRVRSNKSLREQGAVQEILIRQYMRTNKEASWWRLLYCVCISKVWEIRRTFNKSGCNMS